MIARYHAWATRFDALGAAFSNAAAAGDFERGAVLLEQIGAHAERGKQLPSIGNAGADVEWQNAMDDLITAAKVGAPALRRRDSDALLDAMDLISQALDHISNWAGFR